MAAPASEKTLSWDDLAEAVPFEPPSGPEAVPDPAHVPESICESCGTEIVRKPGQRGRLAKRCDDCKTRPVTRRETSPGRRSKAEAEADEIITELKTKAARGIMLVAIADQYTAFVIM